MKPELVKFILKGRALIVGRPDEITVKLQCDSLPSSDYILQSTQIHV